LFSVERTENNKKQAFRAFRTQKYRAAIDFFLFPSSQRKKKCIFSLRSLGLCGENKKETKLHKSTYLSEMHFLQKPILKQFTKIDYRN